MLGPKLLPIMYTLKAMGPFLVVLFFYVGAFLHAYWALSARSPSSSLPSLPLCLSSSLPLFLSASLPLFLSFWRCGVVALWRCGGEWVAARGVCVTCTSA
eukprot:1497442-Rhodomonas_salina.2